MKQSAGVKRGMLGYRVFVGPPLLTGTVDPLPNGERRRLGPLASTLIYGSRDAVLVDVPLNANLARKVADWVEASERNLTHVFVTNGRGDHWFAVSELLRRFEGASVLAAPGTIRQMTLSRSLRRAVWDPMFPGQIPQSPVTATPVTGDRFTLEGHDLLIVDVGRTDTDGTSVLYVPDLELVVAGDVLCNACHLYLGETADEECAAWDAAVDVIERLSPRWAVAAHKHSARDDEAPRVVAETRRYLGDATELLGMSHTAISFFGEMIDRNPHHLGRTALWASACAVYAQREGADPDRAAISGWLGQRTRP